MFHKQLRQEAFGGAAWIDNCYFKAATPASAAKQRMNLLPVQLTAASWRRREVTYNFACRLPHMRG
jgi:hypothetical protein